MASEEHQILVNSLAKALETQKGVTITHIDIDGTPEFFDDKYKNLETPPEHGDDKRIPDIQGVKDGVIHLGEAELDLNDENVDSQLKTFSGLQMTKTGIAVPFHIIVPKNLEKDLHQKISDLGLDSKVKTGQLTVWTS